MSFSDVISVICIGLGSLSLVASFVCLIQRLCTQQLLQPILHPVVLFYTFFNNPKGEGVY